MKDTDAVAKDITMAFPVETKMPMSLSDICNSEDEEAVEETESFVAQPWDQIPPEKWRLHPHAIRLFSDSAFAYYMPSLMRCALFDAKLEYAVFCLLASMREMLPHSPRKLKLAKWRLSRSDADMMNANRDQRWGKLSADQGSVVIEWIQHLMGDPSFMARYGDDAVHAIDYLSGKWK